MRAPDASLENRFAIFLRPILFVLKLGFSVSGLVDIWIAQFVQFGWVWLLLVSIPVCPLAEVIETFFGSPEGLAVKLGFQLHLRFIDQGE